MKLQTQLTLTITLCIVFLVGASFNYLTRHLRDFMIAQNYEHLVSKLNLAVAFLEVHPLQVLDIVQMDKVADVLGHKSGARVTIVTSNGMVVGDSEVPREEILAMENHLFRPEIQAALQQGRGESRRFSATVRREYQYLAMRFRTTPQHEAGGGVVRLAVPVTTFETVMRRLTHIVGIALLALLVLLIISSWVVLRNVSQPVRRIAHIARAIAAGDYSQRTSVAGVDEIHELAEAINFMSEQIKSRIEEVTQGRSRLEAVFLSMVEGVMVLDPEGKITLINQSLRRFLGIEQDPQGKTPIEVIRTLDIQALAREALATVDRIISRQVQISAPEEKRLQVHATAIKRGRDVAGAVLVFHDVTELARLENIRREFVANVSHELRTPIASIKGYAETLLEGAMNERANAQEFLTIILQESNRLAALIDDLLDLARIESGKMVLTPQPLLVKPLAGKVIAGFKRRGEDKNVSLRVEMADDMPPVFADEQRLCQVLVNLIDNAVKFTPAGGRVSITAEADAEYISLRVSDTGVGIPREDQPRLFERFYRVDKARSRAIGGTGLGLAIVKHIVQAHKGEISLTSTPGEGTTVTVRLPRADA